MFFAITILSLILSIIQFRNPSRQPSHLPSARTFIGLIILLVIQVVMLLVNIFVWVPTKISSELVTVIDLLLINLSLIWLFWLLLPVKKTRLPLAIASALSFVYVITAVIALTIIFKDSARNIGAYIPLVLLVDLLVGTGCLLMVLMSHPHPKGLTVLIIAGQAVGVVLQIAIPEGTYLPTYLRLGQLFTFLLLIVYSAIIQQTTISNKKTGSPSSITPRIASAFMELSLQNSSKKLLDGLTHAISLFTMADICCIVNLDLEHSKLKLHHGYDLFREDYLADFELDFSQVPQLSQAFINQTIVSIRDDKSNDFDSLFTATQYNQLGEVTLLPLKFNGHAVDHAFLFLTPYTLHHIDTASLVAIQNIAPSILKVFSQANELEDQKKSIDSLIISLNQATTQRNALQSQLERSQELLAELRSKFTANKAEHQHEIEVWMERQNALEIELGSLKDIAQRSSSALDQLDAIILQKANLEESLANCNQQNRALKHALTSAKSLIDASIVNTDAHSVLEKGMDGLQDINGEIKTPDAGTKSPKMRLIDIVTRLKESLAVQMGIKDLHLDIVNTTPVGLEIPEANKTIALLEALLQNAIKASPNQQGITLATALDEQDPGATLLNLQVTDMGGGLSRLEQENFFAMIDRQGKPVPGGIGDADAIRNVIVLVKQLGGKLWLKSGADKPTTFKVRLPLHTHHTLFEDLGDQPGE